MKNDSIAPYYIVTGGDVAGDYIFYTSENNQILKMKHSAEKREELGKVSYLLNPFHSNSVTGLATSLKRQILVSTSLDKTIRVWSYNNNSNYVQLEICEKIFDEVLCLAVHPTGNYLVVALNSSIRFYSIYPREIHLYYEIPFKSCKEMKFT